MASGSKAEINILGRYYGNTGTVMIFIGTILTISKLFSSLTDPVYLAIKP
ncbi:hypothetical protein ACFLVG_04090 [Chloroflexota bacterium]